RRHTRFSRDWSSDVCSSDLAVRRSGWCAWRLRARDSLAGGARVARQEHARRGAEGVDVEAAAAGVAGVHRQAAGPAALQDVHEDALDALLVEIGVLAEGDQVAQQAVAGDARAGVADLHAGPVRLAGHRAVGLE